MSDLGSRGRAKSYVAQQVHPIRSGRVVWAAGMRQPARLRPRRKARRGRWSAVNPAVVAEQPQQLARTDTGEFRPGDPQPAPSDGSDRAGKTWDWFVNATCWDWYENSSGADRGDTDE